MDRLVKQLSKGKHPIVFEPKTEGYDELKKRLVETKFVFVKFIDTTGETELGINVDDSLTNLEDADFVNGKGNIYVVGICELNYHRVRCITDINLKTKKGSAYLKVLNDIGKYAK